jgi:hypothetical protein
VGIHPKRVREDDQIDDSRREKWCGPHNDGDGIAELRSVPLLSTEEAIRLNSCFKA